MRWNLIDNSPCNYITFGITVKTVEAVYSAVLPSSLMIFLREGFTNKKLLVFWILFK